MRVYISDINHTFIVLIPKIKAPEYITYFRHVSLCNVIYKIISKIVENRMKSTLPFIIFES